MGDPVLPYQGQQNLIPPYSGNQGPGFDYQPQYPPASPDPTQYAAPSQYSAVPQFGIPVQSPYPQGYAYPPPYQQPPQYTQAAASTNVQQQTRVVIVQEARQENYVMYDTAAYGFSPQEIRCPNCNMVVITRVSKTPSAMAWVSCMLLLLVGLFTTVIWCCCVPFLLGSCYDVKHYCPSCGALVGERRR